MRSPAPTDRKLVVATALCALAMIGVPIAILAAMASAGPPGDAGPALLLLAVGPVALPILWAMAPRAFALHANALRIERPIGPISVPLSRVRRVDVLGEGALRGAKRLLGVGGAFGYYGRFGSAALGSFRLYARRSSGPFVLVDTDTERLVLAPADAEAFASALRQRAPCLEATPSARATAVRARGPRRWAVLSTLLAVLALAVAGIHWHLRGRAPVSISVQGDAVRIERLRAQALELPLSEITAVEPLAPHRLRGLRRVDGVAIGNAGYGTYASDELGRFQFYAYRCRGHVLLDGPIGRTVVTPEDPDRFVEQVRARLHGAGP